MCTTWHGVEFGLDFVVSDVTSPIVAVSDRLLQGIIPHFEAPACLIRGEQTMPLISTGPLYYLPVRVSRSDAVNLRHVNMVECCIDVIDYKKNVKLFE
eukprot:9911917-Heterocapsa_arctica.AAC.1